MLQKSRKSKSKSKNHPKSFHSSSVFETGLCDFHKLTLTVLKVFHAKRKPKIIQYKDLDHFNNASSRVDLLQELSIQNDHPREFEKFKYISPKVLNTHAPIKRKGVRCKQSPFMNKQLRNPVMNWTRLINLCVKHLRKSKRVFSNNLNVKITNNNRKLWQTIKPNFTGKTLKDERITFVDGDKAITDEKNVMKNSRIILRKLLRLLKLTVPFYPVLNAIGNFSHHASVLKIKEAGDSSDYFSFKLVTIEDICKEILALDVSKATQCNGMPTKTIKKNFDSFSKFIQANLNNTIERSTFPERLKYADVKPVFKKDSRTGKKTIDQSVFLLVYLKFMKGVSTSN